jgi:hypothetical protein
MTAEVIYLEDYLRKQLGLLPQPREHTMDVQFSDHGSIWLARPLTRAGKAWIEDKVSDDAMWYGAALAIEARYVGDIVDGMAEDGLKVEKA